MSFAAANLYPSRKVQSMKHRRHTARSPGVSAGRKRSLLIASAALIVTSTFALPDLTPAVLFGGRDDPITISTVSGTASDAGAIVATNILYFDYAMANFGATPATQDFDYELIINDATVQTVNVSAPLGSGSGDLTSDSAQGPFAAGTYLARVVVDPDNDVSESDETDNEWTRLFGVIDQNGQSIQGRKWQDINQNGLADNGEPPIANARIYLDLDDSTAFTAGEPFALTDSNGVFSISGIIPGTYVIRDELPVGWTRTFPDATNGFRIGFDIDVVFPDNSISASQKTAFTGAAARWAEGITNDLPDVFSVGLFADDLLVTADGPFIDGAGGTLGFASPTTLRSGSLLPITGAMSFDSADLASMEASGSLTNVILHEMGHVLGIGSLWDDFGQLVGAGGVAPEYTGTQSIIEHNIIFSESTNSVPVEGNASPPGSRDSHWRESIYEEELMTPLLDSGDNPISRVTFACLQDMGYDVDLTAADAFTAPAAKTGKAAQQGGLFLNCGAYPFPPRIIQVNAAARLSKGGPIRLLSSANLNGAHEITLSTAETIANIDFANFAQNADLSITKTGTASVVLASDTLTYLIAVSNAGPGTASNVTVTDTLPSGVVPGGVFVTNLGTMVAGSATTFPIVVSMTTNATGQTTNHVSVSASEPDGDTTNNAAIFIASVLLDGDSDGLSDAWELQHFGNLDQLSDGDLDRDGLSNGLEQERQSDPTARLAPPWWQTQLLLNTNASPNDFAALTTGQLKAIAMTARDAMDAGLPNGAGVSVSNLVAGFSTSNNYSAVNLGQLKTVAHPYYLHLITLQLADGLPWDNAPATNNFSTANIGQTKHLFSFDLTP